MKHVQLQLQTKMENVGESLTQQAKGKLYAKGSGWYLTYRETLDEGMEVSTTLKVFAEEGRALVIRTGSVQMRQEYILGQWTQGKYVSPHGVMWMETKAERIGFDAENRRLELDYLLKLNEEDLGRYILTIDWQEL
ncbi:DUF1934 domain-containing protein [Ammoniphilus resinae]|uniref:Uncharacterized beta-barrel protein YwiB (DUF1934 family) n=1 Tax=Ammoniphilus resinae TaxID=861532 RepID=A0ABS4GUM5_9BACL|nr:DUF1934 domain-containing protein [Ammoniphilus resinae]MBP1933980.1 uncharacterized beta-barrel protein YwiB (DUF1934 family) [Ammoniphilus resinae]